MRSSFLSHMAARLWRPGTVRREQAERQRRSKDERDAERLAWRAEMVAAKQQAQAEGAQRKERERARADADRQALAEAAASAYEHYVCVRNWAGRMRETVSGAALTDGEERVVRELAHLWNAPPETIATLRRWCEPVSGVRVSDYEPASEELAHRLRRELALLWKLVGRELFVPEPAILGGFGDSKKGDLYNEDTVRFFKVLVALQDGAVLTVYRGQTRRLVWEVGGGWGGFAHQFKTVCPNVTYLITGPPDSFLLSAVFLMAAFPGARCRFYDPAAPERLWLDWEPIDFVFAPEGALSSLRPPRLDLVVDLLSLGGMTAPRASAHVERAFDWGSPYIYSLLPGREAYEEATPTVSAVSRFYWPHPIPPRREQARPGTLSMEPDPGGDEGPSHLIGWRRIRV